MADLYQEIRPGPRLARYVECYWRSETDGSAAQRQVLPDGCADILFTSRAGQPTGLIAVGLMTCARSFDAYPGQAFFGVRFQPGMASAFLPEAALLTDRMEPLENISTSLARSINDRLAGLEQPVEMASTMEALLRPMEPPHFIREFEEFAQCTPGRFLQSPAERGT